MNENQSVSVVQRKRCKHEKKKKRRNNIFLSRGAKMCAPSGASPPLPIVSKNSPPPLGDDESKSDKHKREKERSKPIASSHQ